MHSHFSVPSAVDFEGVELIMCRFLPMFHIVLMTFELTSVRVGKIQAFFLENKFVL